ncbi:DUF2059 domain-containing protein [Massilia phosphatilytica]|nr:DUF2059 domain-containing protein [Massilia phosphatilytica]
MKKSLAAIASAIVVTCSPAAFAATPVSSADPAVVAATKQMLASMKIRDVMLASLKQADQQMPAQMAASLNAMIDSDTTLSAEKKAEAHKKLQEALPTVTAQTHAIFADPTLVDDMLAEMVPLYAETYTLDEIRQLSAFYASPLGQKMLANMPTLMSRSMEISQRVMMPRIQKMMAQSAHSIVGK